MPQLDNLMIAVEFCGQGVPAKTGIQSQTLNLDEHQSKLQTRRRKEGTKEGFVAHFTVSLKKKNVTCGQTYSTLL